MEVTIECNDCSADLEIVNLEVEYEPNIAIKVSPCADCLRVAGDNARQEERDRE